MKRYAFLLLSTTAILSACSDGPAYDAAGTFEATAITLSAEATGRVLSLDVQEGDRVTAGQVIGAIDSVQLVLQRLQLDFQQQAVSNTKPDLTAQTAPYEEQLTKLRHEKRRVETLMAAGAATQKQLDDLDAQITLVQSQRDAAANAIGKNLSSLDNNLSALDVQKALLSDLIAKCRITSPIDGVVQVKYTHAGEVTAPGRPLLKVLDTSHFFLRAYFTSVQLAHVKVGQHVRVTADYGNDVRKEFDGTVTWISDESEFTPKSIQTADSRASLVYAAKIAVPNDGSLKTGMYGEVCY